MGKVDFHNTGKVWENTNIPRLCVSQIFWVKLKPTQFPKHGKGGCTWYGKSMGKHKHFKVKGFLNFSYETEIHTVPKIWEKWISIIREKHGKIQAFQIYGFLKYFGEAGIHIIPKIWKK